ncbi:MAG: glycine cleavage system protein H [Acidobacteriia bacterium]|nr:glycine cleavage system protein H [Terriglobia bacterium]
MVAIFVVLTIIVFLLIDYAVQRFQARSAAAQPPQGTPEQSQPTILLSPDSIVVPSTLLFHRGHTWLKFMTSMQARAGLDDFAQKVFGQIEGLQFPRVGEHISQGHPLFQVRIGKHKLFLPAPISGVVTRLNPDLAAHPEIIHSSPFDAGWVCEITPSETAQGMEELLSGPDAVQWELHEMNKLQRFLAGRQAALPKVSQRELLLSRSWTSDCARHEMNEFSKSFLGVDRDRAELLTEVS